MAYGSPGGQRGRQPPARWEQTRAVAPTGYGRYPVAPPPPAPVPVRAGRSDGRRRGPSPWTVATLVVALAATVAVLAIVAPTGFGRFVDGQVGPAGAPGPGGPGGNDGGPGGGPGGADGGPGGAQEVVQRGTGSWQPAGGGSKLVGSGRKLRYRVEVEGGIDQDPAQFARWVDRILADPRGWSADGRWAFQRQAGGPSDFVVRLASPDTVDEVCGRYGLDTNGEVSCRGGEDVVINLRRWLLAIPAFDGDVDMYRHAVVNHEVGHFLGFQHDTCPGAGRAAPVMQTMYFGMDGCRPNGWPFPERRAQ